MDAVKSVFQHIKRVVKLLPLFAIPASFFYRVLPGYYMYAHIWREFGSQIYMQYYPGTGDVYIDCGFLKNYVHKRGLSEKYIFVTSGYSGAAVAQLFGLKRIKAVNRRNAQNMVHFVRFGPGELHIELLHYHDAMMYTACAFQTIGLHGVNFFEQYLYSVFVGLTEEDFLLPNFSQDERFVKNLFMQLNLIPGRTVLLAPYANTETLQIDAPAFWEKLAGRIKEAGYAVCTNAFGKNEPPILGTIPVSVPYTYCKLFLEQAGFFIGVRSGLCEVISSIRCKKIILYPDVDWPEDRALKVSAQQIFSISHLPHAEDVFEMVFCQEYSRNIICQTINILSRGSY